MSETRTVHVLYKGLPLVIKGSWCKGCPGTMYKGKYGDPGDPPEDPEFDIEEVHLEDGTDIEGFFDDLYHKVSNKKSASDYADTYREIENLCIEQCQEYDNSPDEPPERDE